MPSEVGLVGQDVDIVSVDLHSSCRVFDGDAACAIAYDPVQEGNSEAIVDGFGNDRHVAQRPFSLIDGFECAGYPEGELVGRNVNLAGLGRVFVSGVAGEVKPGDGETRFSIDVFAQAVQAQGAKPSWTAVQEMKVEEIAKWFEDCGL